MKTAKENETIKIIKQYLLVLMMKETNYDYVWLDFLNYHIWKRDLVKVW